jgi:hypothetical protein
VQKIKHACRIRLALQISCSSGIGYVCRILHAQVQGQEQGPRTSGGLIIEKHYESEHEFNKVTPEENLYVLRTINNILLIIVFYLGNTNQ